MTTQNENPYTADEINKSAMFWDIAKQMVVGAMAGGGVLIAAGVFIYVVYLVGLLLPPESKEADDPTPDSFSAYEQPYLPQGPSRA